MNHFCSSVQIADPYEVEVPCKNPKTSKGGFGKGLIVFATYMTFWKLGENYPQVSMNYSAWGRENSKPSGKGLQKSLMTN